MQVSYLYRAPATAMTHWLYALTLDHRSQITKYRLSTPGTINRHLVIKVIMKEEWVSVNFTARQHNEGIQNCWQTWTEVRKVAYSGSPTMKCRKTCVFLPREKRRTFNSNAQSGSEEFFIVWPLVIFSSS